MQIDLKVFYYDAVTRSCIQADEAIEVDAEEIREIWNSLTQQEGSYLGIERSDDACVQFRWQDSEVIAIDIPRQQLNGSMTKEATFEECSRVIADFCSGGDPEDMSGLVFFSW